jgi:acetyl-CoA carboxylase carboxyltransferase component
LRISRAVQELGLQAIEAPEERAATYEKMVADMYKRGKAVNMASHFELDDVIEPADTQSWISRCLRSMP